ncbi:MAG: DUF998 domain-containing protein [Burkholderiales bacterium]|jgi:asparagine N-glycosylation enzyme membrane subunit Stt3
MGQLALAGLLAFVAAVLTLHAAQPELSPRDDAVSYYVHGRLGALLTAGLAGLGIASLALVAGLARVAPASRLGLWLLGVWGVGVLLGALFRADPPGRWSEPPTFAGMVHGNSAITAFVALPIAALVLSRALRQQAEWRPDARLLTGLAVAAAVGLALFTASLMPVFVRPGPPILLGASERLLLACYVAWLAVVGVGLLKHDPRPASG